MLTAITSVAAAMLSELVIAGFTATAVLFVQVMMLLPTD